MWTPKRGCTLSPFTLLSIKDNAKLCYINHLKKMKFLIINLVSILLGEK